jgi:hypothetical protein
MHRILPVAALSLLTGCASYRPLPSEAEHIAFRDHVTKAMQEEGKAALELTHVKKALAAYSAVTLNALKTRASRSWDNSDITTVGGAGAVLGGLAEKTGLLNAGLFTAGLGLAGASRMKLDQQVDLTLATFRKLSCIGGRVGMLTPEVQRLARDSSDPVALSALASAPEDAVRWVEQVQDAHLTSLYALKPSVPTKAELLDYFGRFSTAQTAASTAATARSPGRSVETEAAIKLVRTFAVDLETCSKLG